MRRLRLAAIILVPLVAAAPAVAQQTPAIAPAHEAAVLELFEVMELEEQVRASVALLGGAAGDTSGAASAFGETLLAFFEEHMSWDALRPGYVRIYADVYTEAELRELIAFYRTPIGRKTVEVSPRLIRRSAEVGARIMRQHGPELQRLLLEQAQIRQRGVH
ncbi:MAG: DUF2059 domain-containing protein [Planctomycetaceae bacterium]